VLKRGTVATVIIYWEWIYELQFYTETGEVIPQENLTDEQKEAIRAHDEFDTEVGRNPELYVKDMNAVIHIAELRSDPRPHRP
jgi:hypothetical protein